MFTITKRFEVAASHVLAGLPEGHKCGRLHGHNYGIEVELATAEPDKHGFVVDYGDLAVFELWLKNSFDHRHLNDCMTANPTAEHLALVCMRRLFELWPEHARAVRVFETAKTMAEYRLTPS